MKAPYSDSSRTLARSPCRSNALVCDAINNLFGALVQVSTFGPRVQETPCGSPRVAVKVAAMRHERIGDAKAVRIAAFGELDDAVTALGLHVGVPVLVVVGGADSMSRAEEARVNALIEALVPHLDRLGGALVDGGTATGVMRAAGDARMSANGHFPLIGVVVDPLARRPGGGAARDGTNLDRGHTHFLFVPGADWGDESPWLARFAVTLAGPASSATLLANGGDIAWKDVEHS